MIGKKKFYENMENFSWEDGFTENLEKWFACFEYTLKHLNKDFNKSLTKSLFWDFEMSNSKMFWIENNPEYKHLKNKYKELFEKFSDDAEYCSDRMSFDRLFRLHWLFREIYNTELTEYRYGSINEKAI